MTPIPQGTVAFFALEHCPTEAGWAEFEPLRSRHAVGLTAGGNLGMLVGQTLANGENRPTGRHRHGDTVGEGGFAGADFGGNYGSGLSR